jgi:hypothetical protein
MMEKKIPYGGHKKTMHSTSIRSRGQEKHGDQSYGAGSALNIYGSHIICTCFPSIHKTATEMKKHTLVSATINFKN